MSQTLEHIDHQPSGREFGEFAYKPVPAIAAVTVASGVLSAISLLTVLGLGVGLFGLILGIVCLRKIGKSQGELGGRGLTRFGVALSLSFLIGGSAYHSYAYATEVPDGFRRISFYSDISQKGFPTENGVPSIHPQVKKLDGKKVFLKGYMYPTKQLTGIAGFVLVKDNQQCCFGGQPDVKDMIEVVMQDDKTVKDYRGLMSVAGVFRLSNADSQSPLAPVYRMDASYAAPATTSF